MKLLKITSLYHAAIYLNFLASAGLFVYFGGMHAGGYAERLVGVLLAGVMLAAAIFSYHRASKGITQTPLEYITHLINAVFFVLIAPVSVLSFSHCFTIFIPSPVECSSVFLQVPTWFGIGIWLLAVPLMVMFLLLWVSVMMTAPKIAKRPRNKE